MNINKTKTYHVGDYTFVNFINLDDDTIENIRLWRNHPDIRKVMYNTKEISREEHHTFIKTLRDSTTKSYWIAYKNDSPIGVVSVFDIDKLNDRAELGYYLFPSNLNSGIAVEFITYAHQLLFEKIGFQTIYGGTNQSNSDALLLNEYFGGEFSTRKELNGEIFIHHEISRQRFEERKDGLSNWRNFVRYCKARKLQSHD